MRKLMVIAAVVLASASAQGGQTRSLTRADLQVAATDQAKPVEPPSEKTQSTEAAAAPDVAKPADAPKFVERPGAVEPTRSQTAPATATQPPSAADATGLPTARAAKADRPRHRQRDWTESRIIGELHRHGIYW